MPEESIIPLRELALVLNRHGVEYIVIGGQAETLMGSPRVTFDTDLCYRRTPENIRRLAAALAELEVTLRGAPPGLPFRADAATLSAGLNFTLNSKVGDVDLMGEVEPVGDFDKIIRSAEVYQVGEITLRTISLDDLIRVKRHIRRGKDVESLNQLLAIKRVPEQSGSK